MRQSGGKVAEGRQQEKRALRLERLIIDIWMTAGLMFSMGYQIFSPSDHEWSGTVLLVLFVCHHLLNRKWYAHLLRGRYTVWRALSTAVDLALLVFLLLLMWSGIAMSQYVFTFLPSAGGMSLMRGLHLLSSRWAFVLMAFHLGLHWRVTVRAGRGVRLGLLGLAAAAAAYGLYAFAARDFAPDMFFVDEFAFPSYEASPAVFYADYLAVFEAFVFFGYAARKIMLRRKPGGAERG